MNQMNDFSPPVQEVWELNIVVVIIHVCCNKENVLRFAVLLRRICYIVKQNQKEFEVILNVKRNCRTFSSSSERPFVQGKKSLFNSQKKDDT